MKNPNPLIHYSILAIIFFVGALTLLGHTVLHASESTAHEHSSAHEAAEPHEHCETTGKTYTLKLKDEKFSPDSVDVNRCDRLKIINQDATDHELAFGSHSNHAAYPGFGEEHELEAGESFTFSLPKSGNLVMHDHNNVFIRAEINVSK